MPAPADVAQPTRETPTYFAGAVASASLPNKSELATAMLQIMHNTRAATGGSLPTTRKQACPTVTRYSITVASPVNTVPALDTRIRARQR